MTEHTRRRYRSDLRQENAQATRQRIADAARALMLERGYAATTMVDVAQAAGVAVQTLYSSCPGGKPGLAKLVYDVTLAGDGQPIPQAARPQVQAIIAEPDPARKLLLFAEMAVGIYERIGPVHRVLRSAAAAGGGLTDLLVDTERQRRTGSRGPAEHLAEVGELRVGLTVERAADQIYVLTSIELFERFTEICGWSLADCRDWLARALADTLLEPHPRT
ncbi:TetR/AcrR family transcriptional regulator [Catellatospora citrea]|uniref:DNA-binding protein n=1 Tax=Catellatospora citrea TaxID=53366 RepID=A0A8J3K1A2_9ACTN|nr:helix-turn-helix domain-containing protein [Catellatospora citrea]GIF94911.1 DNA-binding protein [Catellatospora citrea]